MVSPSRDTASSSQANIDKLVMHIQQRDSNARVAYEELYMRYVHSVYRHVKYCVQDPHVAEELTNDIFLSVWIGLPRKSESAPFDAWLFKIASNRVVDYWRETQKERCVPLPDDELEDGIGQPIPSLASSEPGVEEIVCDQDSVKRILDRLNPTVRFCVILHVQWGFSQKEIAEKLDVDPRRVNDYIRRASKALCGLYPDRVAAKELRSRAKEV
jgi:RNA polymerase sigma factor (sigma-70 family)